MTTPLTLLAERIAQARPAWPLPIGKDAFLHGRQRLAPR
jgi:hypothetical protein